MIETLRISNLAIVERVEIEFGPGLNVLTGETGAGKSVVLGALSWLAGARASTDSIRAGAEEACVEAVFRTERLPELESALAERGLEPSDHELVVGRRLGRNGRSRAFVSGRLVPVGTLSELFAGRLEVSSQHESQALRRTERHGELLDAFGELTPLAREVADSYRAWREARAEHARLLEAAEERRRREDFLRYQRDEIDAAKLTVGEFEALEAERSRLVHAEQLGAECARAAAELVGDPGATDLPAASDRTAQAARRVAELSRLDAGLAPLAERLDAAAAELRDAAADLQRYADRVEADPRRLAELDERLALLERLRRKYGRSEPEILATRDEIAHELAALQQGEERCSELEGELERLRAALERAAQALSQGRARAARRLERQLGRALADAGMAQARIETALERRSAPEGAPCGPGGLEQPEFGLIANPGEPPRALRRIASGGELSRVFLALKNVLRRADQGMVLVFDEVDAGIGGAAAERVGRLLAELAQAHQVLCITHLPQIAAQAERHLCVEKRQQGRRAAVGVCPLGEEGRIDEIARMAGGERVSGATRRHARALLGDARPSGRRSGPQPRPA